MSDVLKRDDILVVQLTGRMHFGAARGLNGQGRLSTLLTDFYLPRSLKLLSRVSNTLSTYDIDLPPQKVRGNPLVGLAYRYKLRRSGHFRTKTHIEASKALARQALRISAVTKFSTVYSFDIQALETFQSFSHLRVRLVLEQCVAPRRSQIEVLNHLQSYKPMEDYEARVAQLELLAKRETEEWKLADEIICPSNYVRDELIRWGVRPDQIAVVPYGYSREPDELEPTARASCTHKCRAIFVGTVEPRKGPQDAVAALGSMESGLLTLSIFGSLERVNPADFAGPNVELHGKVSFNELKSAYRSADMFVLPSYLEGSATAVYEAMSYGLPCIVTPETGSVVRDGIDGFIVRAGDTDMIADRLSRLCQDRELREQMGRAAAKRAQEFTFEKYGERLCMTI